ncbi:MAG: hypothetical protein OEV56_01090 [Dehalococcoidia bacterium]|nr:hypothetical protein [Dehalococcoidia bacterium]
MIALAGKPVKTYIVGANYHYQASLRGTTVPKQSQGIIRDCHAVLAMIKKVLINILQVFLHMD